MKATLEKVAATRNGAGLLVTLRITQATERVHTYRVTDEEYQSAGAPSEGDVLEGDALAVLTEREDTRLAYERALKILAAGDNTRAALLRKLRERGFSQVVSEAAVARALENGYVKEEEMLLRQLAVYAKRLWGPRKFIPALLQKGFSRESIEKALRRAAEEEVYDKETVKEALLAEFSPKDEAERRSLLYKHGFC
ncbi:MAG: RecX family transcriptional regulator [Clostridia bacterium]|jgi:SOS response regulatory protein OraA/RecX|nr:RecX family transcriptional regulator [Clostridia bacterium]MBO7169559.1 RecX family transcriptional regulator [Clostridia bacterium]